MSKRLLFVLLGFGIPGAVLLGAGALFFHFKLGFHPEIPKPGKFPEQLVYVCSADNVVSGGVLFTPAKESARSVAIIWVHGWGANFYNPSYVAIGRALADRGFTTLSVNTRMHDLGNVEKYSLTGKRVRGGGYWGVTSEDARDIAAWVNYAEQSGYSRVILVGHSAGWASVARYQADAQDRRVAGLVFASPAVGDPTKWDDPQLTAQAKKLVDEGAGEDLIRLPRKSYPSYISAATYLDTATTPREYRDFFGTDTPNPAVTRVACPILAFFGSNDEVGGQTELDLLKASLQRLPHGPRSVRTAMIANGSHEYVGEEAQVAGTIARWAEEEPMRH
jgi:pimeloyl-ACP methyl ester carboxylesterase